MHKAHIMLFFGFFAAVFLLCAAAEWLFAKEALRHVRGQSKSRSEPNLLGDGVGDLFGRARLDARDEPSVYGAPDYLVERDRLLPVDYRRHEDGRACGAVRLRPDFVEQNGFLHSLCLLVCAFALNPGGRLKDAQSAVRPVWRHPPPKSKSPPPRGVNRRCPRGHEPRTPGDVSPVPPGA